LGLLLLALSVGLSGGKALSRMGALLQQWVVLKTPLQRGLFSGRRKMERWQEWADYEPTVKKIVAGRVADMDVRDDVLSEVKVKFFEGIVELKAESIKPVVEKLLTEYYHLQKVHVAMRFKDDSEMEFAAPDSCRPDYVESEGKKMARLKSKRPVAVDAFVRFCRTLDGKDKLALDMMLRKCKQDCFAEASTVTKQALIKRSKRLTRQLASFLQVPVERVDHAVKSLRPSKDAYQPVIPF
jgi:hypothetical protein